MLRIATLLIAGLIVCPISTTFPAWAAQNFDCSNTNFPPESVWCSKSLLALDSELNEVVEKQYAKSDTRGQRRIYGNLIGWFNDMSSRCGGSEVCMTQAYREEIDRLRQEVGLPPRKWPALVTAMHDPAAVQEAPDQGTGLMLRKALNIKSALELSGASLCVIPGTTEELDVANYFSTNKMEFSLVAFNLPEEVFAAYSASRCDAMAADASELDAARLRLTDPDDHVVLPERL